MLRRALDQARCAASTVALTGRRKRRVVQDGVIGFISLVCSAASILLKPVVAAGTAVLRSERRGS